MAHRKTLAGAGRTFTRRGRSNGDSQRCVETGPETDELEFSVAEDAGTWVIGVAGTIDMRTARSLRQKVTEVVSAGERRSVSLDMSGVTFIDSSGLGALVACYSAAEKYGDGLVIGEASAPVHRILEITKQTSRFMPGAS